MQIGTGALFGEYLSWTVTVRAASFAAHTPAAPTLVVTGDTDRVIPPATARRYHELISGSQILVLDQTGHLPQEERSERVVTEITRWMDAHP